MSRPERADCPGNRVPQVRGALRRKLRPAAARRLRRRLAGLREKAPGARVQALRLLRRLSGSQLGHLDGAVELVGHARG